MTGRRISDATEAELIALFAANPVPSGDAVVIDNGDDAAAWTVPAGHAVVATTDSLVQNVHFELGLGAPRSIGRKLVAVNASDLASMGVAPRYTLLSVHLPLAMEWTLAEAIASGVFEACREHGISIIGGNVTRSPGPIVLAATMTGSAAPSVLLRRGESRVGDTIFVTRTLGDAAAGLIAKEGALLDALVDPVPRVTAGVALGESGLVHSMCDISDGLARDLSEVLADGQGASIDVEALPISDALRAFAEDEAIRYALKGGEDYELLFTAASEAAAALGSIAPLTAIGVVTDTGELRTTGGARVEGGFDHFRSPSG